MQKRPYPLFLAFAILTLIFSFFQKNQLGAQSGCPGCLVSLPPLPDDTIYISPAPDGEAGVFYDGDIGFRMPKTTTPVNAVDPGTPAGLGINSITIVSVVNVPPGLSWQPSQFEFDPGDETDGCVKFCGTPLQSGYYEVQVFVTAQVITFSSSTSFTFPIYIAPATSSTDGFSMQNSAGCGAVTVGFENNIPSNGQPGFSYAWDFGNGNTSSEENPGPQLYDQPGIYEVGYTATIDTFGYLLTTVRVLDAGCDDIGLPTSVPPDLYVKIKDPAGNLVVSTDPVDNVSFPAAFNINLPLEDGEYELEIRDDDVIGSQSCGYLYFDKNNTDTLVNGDLVVIVDIIHPVSAVVSTDSVFVFEIPPAPDVQPGGTIDICDGDDAELEVFNYQDNLQWYRDTSVIFGETTWSLSVTAAGSYWVEYTSTDGCKSQSDVVTVELLPLPVAPAFHTEGNVLVLNDPSLLPAEYSLQWFQDGTALPGETGETLCITSPGTALYTLQVTDQATGCVNDFSIGATFDPANPCATATGELAEAAASLLVSPNPTGGRAWVSFEMSNPETVRLMLLDVTGRLVFDEKIQPQGSEFRHELDLAGQPAGMYFLKIQLGNDVIGTRILKQG